MLLHRLSPSLPISLVPLPPRLPLPPSPFIRYRAAAQAAPIVSATATRAASPSRLKSPTIASQTAASPPNKWARPVMSSRILSLSADSTPTIGLKRRHMV